MFVGVWTFVLVDSGTVTHMPGSISQTGCPVHRCCSTPAAAARASASVNHVHGLARPRVPKPAAWPPSVSSSWFLLLFVPPPRPIRIHASSLFNLDLSVSPSSVDLHLLLRLHHVYTSYSLLVYIYSAIQGVSRSSNTHVLRQRRALCPSPTPWRSATSSPLPVSSCYLL